MYSRDTGRGNSRGGRGGGDRSVTGGRVSRRTWAAKLNTRARRASPHEPGRAERRAVRRARGTMQRSARPGASAWPSRPGARAREESEARARKSGPGGPVAGR